MNAERTLVQAKVKVKAGDRAGAVALLDVVLTGIRERKRRRKTSTAANVQQLAFAALSFHCEAYDVDITAVDCIQRAKKVYPSGGRKNSPCWRQCAACEQGKAVALACPGIEIRPASQWPDVLPASQRMAKRAKALVANYEPGETWSMDPMKEAATMSPDDTNDWKG
jgi:hypothetical protein